MSAADFIVAALYRALYLDTNIWSDLAKGVLRSVDLEQWLEEESGYLVLSRFQLAELVVRSDLVEDLVRLFARLRTALVERGGTELQGERWVWNSGYEHFQLLRLDDPATRAVLVDEMLHGPITRVQGQLASDRASMQAWIERSVDEAPVPTRHPWRRFPDLMDKYVGFALPSRGLRSSPLLASRSPAISRAQVAVRCAFCEVLYRPGTVAS